MAGFLSGVFESDGGGSRSSEQSLDEGIDNAFAHEETVGVSHSESVSFETPDGTMHSWSNSQDLTLTVGLDATLGAAADVTQGSSEEF